MDNTINLGLTGDQAAQLSELIEECLQELRASIEEMDRRQLRINALQSETKAIIARMKQRVRESQNVEELL
jgi:signal transduction histidine kinase